MPMSVYAVGILFKTEKYSLSSLGNIMVVGTGICIASYGESNPWQVLQAGAWLACTMCQCHFSVVKL